MSERKKIQEALTERSHGAFPTASPVGDGKWAQDVRTFSAGTVTASDAVDSYDATTNEITAAGHIAIAGNILRFTSGALTQREFTVYEVTVNTIKVAEDLSPGPAAADTFDILAPITQTLSSTGGFATINTFVLDGGNQVVTEDTVTPANNRPLPVKLMSTTGDINITANDLNVELDHTSDTVRLGDGTDLTNVTAAGELNVIDTAANALLTTIDGDTSNLDVALSTRATEATLSAMNAKLVSGTDIGDVTINNAAGASAVNVQDGGNSLTVDDGGVSLSVDDAGGSITVDSTNLDVRDLSHTQDSVRLGDGTNLADVNASAELQVRDDDANTSLTSLAGTVSGTEVQVDVVASLPAGTNNIGDVDVVSSALPTGAATEATLATIDIDTGNIAADTTVLASTVSGLEVQVDVVAPLPAGTNVIGEVGIDHLSTVDFLDTPLLDAASTNIPVSGTYLQVVASTAATISKIQVFDTTGEFYGIFTGPAASEALVAVVGPGSNESVEVSIASGTRVSLSSLSASAITIGNVSMNFMG